LSGRFSSVFDVVANDPMRIATMYARDFYDLLQRLLTADFTLNSPLNLLVVPGLVYLAASTRPFLQHLAILVVPQVLLLNLVFPDQRYFLLLVPVFGAGAMGTLLALLKLIGERRSRAVVFAFFAACWLVAVATSARAALRSWTMNEAELAQAVPAVDAAAIEGALLIARKPHIGYYAAVPWKWVPPDVRTVAELEAHLARETAPEILVYLGSEELKLRPQLRLLVAAPPPWLAAVASGTDSVPWTLFRYVRREPAPQ
jgi:hypothetical protein